MQSGLLFSRARAKSQRSDGDDGGMVLWKGGRGVAVSDQRPVPVPSGIDWGATQHSNVMDFVSEAVCLIR